MASRADLISTWEIAVDPFHPLVDLSDRDQELRRLSPFRNDPLRSKFQHGTGIDAPFLLNQH